MQEFQILVLQSTNEFRSELVDTNPRVGIRVAFATDDVRQATAFLNENRVDAVFVELAAPTADAYEFIDQLSFRPEKPLIAVASALSEESYFVRARRLGAKMAYRAPYRMDRILDEIRDWLAEEISPALIQIRSVSEKLLDERLANIFIASGIPPHIKGYQYLREAVKQSVRTPSMINNITKQLYPAVAERFCTSASKVERAIRHAIEVAWSRGKIDNINSIYGIKVFGKGEKPTNGELIALVSDKMIIECS